MARPALFMFTATAITYWHQSVTLCSTLPQGQEDEG